MTWGLNSGLIFNIILLNNFPINLWENIHNISVSYRTLCWVMIWNCKVWQKQKMCRHFIKTTSICTQQINLWRDQRKFKRYVIILRMIFPFHTRILSTSRIPEGVWFTGLCCTYVQTFYIQLYIICLLYMYTCTWRVQYIQMYTMYCMYNLIFNIIIVLLLLLLLLLWS